LPAKDADLAGTLDVYVKKWHVVFRKNS